MTAPALGPAGVRDKLRHFILAELLRQPAFPLADDEPLMSGGLIDSFCVAHLGVFIENEFGVYIPDVDLTVENMDSLALIAEQVLRRAGAPD